LAILAGKSEVAEANNAPSNQIELEGLGPRERVLVASLKLFVEKGYFNTNIPDISKLSKCSVGSIYHHFLNKEEIASSLYLDGIARFRNALSDGITNSMSAEETIKSLVTNFLEFSERRPLYSRYIWLARHDEFLNQELTRPTMVGFDQLGRKLTRTFKTAIRNKEIVDTSAEVIWSIVFGIPLSFVTDWLDGYTRRTPSEAAPELARAAVAALKISK